MAIIGIPCIGCRQFSFTMNRDAYYRANVEHLAFLCRDCRALPEEQVAERVQESGLADIPALLVAIEGEYMRLHLKQEETPCHCSL